MNNYANGVDTSLGHARILFPNKSNTDEGNISTHVLFPNLSRMTIALAIPEFAVPQTEDSKAGDRCRSRKSLRDVSFHIAPLNLAFYSVTLAFLQLLYYSDVFIPAYSDNMKFHPYLKGPLLIAYAGMFLNCLFSNFKQRRILQLILTLLPLILIQVVAILFNPEAISIAWLAVLSGTGLIGVVIWAIWWSMSLQRIPRAETPGPSKIPEICVVDDGQMASANVSVNRKLSRPSSWTCGRYTVYPLSSPEDDHWHLHPELGKSDSLSTNRDTHSVDCWPDSDEEGDKDEKERPKGAEKVELDNGYGSL
ncbi:hypothetical protein DdX_17037 [Ditylenchus destructor]|uniref:Uncharacterized protein n=1 Tax=Ditylenchus destructor TaxID=166010 RepID=A0AAD4MNH2_9BILA|nr:hypothetical protein DdX_17037 [Ditylenchus destructor]